MSSEPGGREAGDEGRRSEPASWKKMKRNLNLIKALEHPIRAQAFRLLVERGKMSPAEIGREIGERTDKVSHPDGAFHYRRNLVLTAVPLRR